jgi:hypothetical protein
VRLFVERRLNESAKFALGESSSFLAVHRTGVSSFRGPRTQPSSDAVQSELVALERSS